MAPTERVVRVTVSGDRTGHYVVREEREDGSLVLTPDAEASDLIRARVAPATGGLIGRLRGGQPKPQTVPEILESWGVLLGREETVSVFMFVEVDGRTGFAAVTGLRFIFAAQGGLGSNHVTERPLSDVRTAELSSRGRRSRLHVRWGDGEMVIGADDQDALKRLGHQLGA